MDTERVCDALEIEPEALADVARREAARLLRRAAKLLEEPELYDETVDITRVASRWLVLSELFEEEWERRGDGDASSEATSEGVTAAAPHFSERVR